MPSLYPIPAARAKVLERLRESRQYDVAIVGGGATGAGVALEAAARGYSVVLVEAHDFAKGTSSRATKLVHGGVRYLARGDIGLVREALRERRNFFSNAAHLAQPLGFIMPAYRRRDLALYGVGLKVYDAIAGAASVGPTQILGRTQVQLTLPTLRDKGLRGGVRYWDGQFDDARMALAVARSAARLGAVIANYCPVTSLVRENGKVKGLRCKDAETGAEYELRAKCVVNATGVWSDSIRNMEGQPSADQAPSAVRPSQGAHVVVDRSFWPSGDALLVPKTVDGRVLFAIPWMGATLLGTTDTARSDCPVEPSPTTEEVDFILSEASAYLNKAPTRKDVKSAWAGLRPLASASTGSAKGTSSVSREHAVEVSEAGLVSVTGGKWTTYRLMAEHVLLAAIKSGLLHERLGSTRDLQLVGAVAEATSSLSAAPGYHLYGSEQYAVKTLPGAGRMLAPGLSESMVRFAARYEYARTVEDILARRSRVLFLDAAAAMEAADRVGAVMESELGIDVQVAEFRDLCAQYMLR